MVGKNGVRKSVDGLVDLLNFLCHFTLHGGF